MHSDSPTSETIKPTATSGAGRDLAGGPQLPSWADYMDALKPIGERLAAKLRRPDSALDRQETWRTMTSTLAQGFVHHVYADPDHPEFVPLFNTALNLAAPNADFVYLRTPVKGDATYRLRGYRGTNLFTELSVQKGFYALGTAAPTLATYYFDDAKLDADGAFDIIVSQERPAGYDGDWWPLDPAAGTLGLKKASYDWVKEQDSVVAIECLSTKAQRPRLTAAELAERIGTLAMWVEKGAGLWLDRINEMHRLNLVNTMNFQNWSTIGGSKGQIYLEGLYQLEDDEALIIETEVPTSCRYWSFLVGDNQFTTIDWMNRQSSLNGFQAQLDSDGKFRGVISPTDPGVPNWLDTGGNNEGIIQGRWNNANTNPQPEFRKVKLRDLRNHLPGNTPEVSPDQRDAALRTRRLGAQLRRRW